MMRTLLWASRVFIFLFLLGFALKNTDPVTVRFILDTSWQAPLVIVVLAFFAGGAALGALALLGTLFQQRREIARLRKEIERSEHSERSKRSSAEPQTPLDASMPPIAP